MDVNNSADTDSVVLSVVVIAENEEDRIRECLESVFAACRDIRSYEIILVDSASTDRTVEYASEYPITILRIPDEHTISCGAGRYVGDHAARGDLVLHIDGDMVLTETWLPSAIDHLSEPGVAAVEGNLDRSNQTAVMDVDKIGGVMLYDADALAEVGGFDPYLLGYEDVDVGFRLKEAGYRLLRLPSVSAIHHDEKTFSEPLQRWRKGYLTAPGQAIRKWAGSPAMLRRLLGRQRYKLALLTWSFAGLASLLLWPLFIGWLALSIVGFGVVASKRGVSGAAQFFLAKGIGVVGLAVGLGTPTSAAESYPLDAVEVIKQGTAIHGHPPVRVL